MKAYRVKGIYGGDPAEGDYITWVWAANEADAAEQCINEMDENNEYCKGTNQVTEVELLAKYIASQEALLRSARQFIKDRP